MARPSRLRWIGALDHRGMPRAWVTGVPARDLDADDIGQLSDEALAAARASGLYEEPAKPAKATAMVAETPAGGEG